MGNIVGMAYVVARPKGRFEIRESVHTPKGPRARSLANFAHFDDEVLDRARRRASRPFDAEGVRAAAAKVARRGPAIIPRHEQPETRRFVEASRRMSRSLERVAADGGAPGPRRRARSTCSVSWHRSRLSGRPAVGSRCGSRPWPACVRRAWQGPRTDDQGPTLTRTGQFDDLAPKIISLHELLDSAGVPHQFGGAIALAWYRNPRATTDIDVNLTLPPAAAEPVLAMLARLGVTVTPEDRAAIALDGQARLDWGGSYLDVFFATMDLHLEMAELARVVRFGPVDIPILAPEHLVACKAIFDRPKDWLDIEEILRWGTEIDADRTLHWVGEILGPEAGQYARLAGLLGQRAVARPHRP